MARFLTLWRMNPLAPWPTDPSKALELGEKMWAGLDNSIKKGEIKDYGVFPDGRSGYAIAEGGATEENV